MTNVTVIGEQAATPKRKLKILFFAADPGTKKLALDKEAMEIQRKLRLAAQRDSIELLTRWATTYDDLMQELLENEPDIVHFSGHGSGAHELILLDKNGKGHPVRKEALVSLFRTLKDNIRVVVLNACFSHGQAEAIAKEIDCTIGMSDAISDEAAIKFAAAFYSGIGFGRSIQTAFDLGKNAILGENIPEEHIPQLLCRGGIIASSVTLTAK